MRGTEVTVQFNPTSLKLQMTNSTDGAASRGRQTQQYNGSASTTLSVQLEFDTADEGTTSKAVDVRSRTAQVARFVLPGGTGSKQAPPRVQFRWGTVIVGGVMTSMSEELTLFSSRGVPLRASVSVEIKQQDPKFEALERGPGANPGSRAPAAGQRGAGAGPGTAGGGGDRTAEAPRRGVGRGLPEPQRPGARGVAGDRRCAGRPAVAVRGSRRRLLRLPVGGGGHRRLARSNT